MINKRLIKTSPTSMKFVRYTVLYQWIGLIFNMIALFTFAHILQCAYIGEITTPYLIKSLVTIIIAIIIRSLSSVKATKASYYASRTIKNDLRQKIYHKLLALGLNYNKVVSTSKVIQVSTEGVEQIEIYFARYLPQFFYSMLAPLTLFIVLGTMNIKVALILLICVPLIPMSIIAVNKFAKRLFKKYWSSYTALGDHFLDNLSGLTTLKVYGADEAYHKQMNKDAEHFRKITMKVLTMQLNSITLMDLIAYGGAALGIGFSLFAFYNGELTLCQCIFFILVTSEFFIPMRLLGSYFHVAMNGVSAAQSIFEIIDSNCVTEIIRDEKFTPGKIEINNLIFAYDDSRQILKDISLSTNETGLFSFVGKSGCGKSTIVSLLMGFQTDYLGEITIGGVSLNNISEQSLNMCIVKHQNYLFRGTIRDNLCIANKDATDEMLLLALKQVCLIEEIKSKGGLDYILLENGSNLSGGQRQRLALARALIRDASIYIFDEATSNIDIESETIFNNVMLNLAKHKLVLLISHRLANVIPSDKIFVLEKGVLVETGTHKELLANHGVYHKLFMAQAKLEEIYKGGQGNE
ncbi:MAG: cysteine ABC transporter ATP-binding protein [Epulopiscium sp. Nuni2H_MBin003]|nr:MAG: cysteine ABC transporter ATP-binding protein [Epulopiscium sp. Nuni2H_MBin003]